MRIIYVNDYEYRFLFDDEEVEFLKRESKENNLTVKEILLMVMGTLFITGYSGFIGKES